MQLTDTKIRNAKPAGKAIRLPDGKGLYIEVSPSGGRLWRLRYRFAGKEKLLALGKYPAVSLKEARERCDEARKLLAGGTDPSHQKKVDRQACTTVAANTFEAVAREWFEKHSPQWAPSHSSKVFMMRDVR